MIVRVLKDDRPGRQLPGELKCVRPGKGSFNLQKSRNAMFLVVKGQKVIVIVDFSFVSLHLLVQ